MRKTTKKMAKYFLDDKEIKEGSTQVESCKGVTMLFLYDSAIVKSTTCNGRKHIEINDCGYRTQTTKERINGVLSLLGLDLVKQKKGAWYWDNKELKENENIEVACLDN